MGVLIHYRDTVDDLPTAIRAIDQAHDYHRTHPTYASKADTVIDQLTAFIRWACDQNSGK